MKKSKSCEEMIDHNELQNQNENNDLNETISLQLNSNSINERWHNRFSKENRQKLISQQQAIDQKVKLTRAQKQLEEATKRQHGISTKLSTPLKRPTSIPTEHSDSMTDNHSSYIDNRNIRRQTFFNVTRASLTRSPHLESYAKMQQEDEEDSDNLSISYISDKRTPSQQQQKSKIYNIDEDTYISDDNYNNINRTNHSEDGEEMILTAAKLTPLIITSPNIVSSTSIINTSRC
jgi:hypothetical protein